MLTRAINEGRQAMADALAASRQSASAAAGRRIQRPEVKEPLAAVNETMLRRSQPFAERRTAQRAALRCRSCRPPRSAPSPRPPRSARPGRP